MKDIVRLYLRSGIVFDAIYEDDDYDEIYETWESGKGLLRFVNGSFLASEVIGISWKEGN